MRVETEKEDPEHETSTRLGCQAAVERKCVRVAALTPTAGKPRGLSVEVNKSDTRQT